MIVLVSVFVLVVVSVLASAPTRVLVLVSVSVMAYVFCAGPSKSLSPCARGRTSLAVMRSGRARGPRGIKSRVYL